MSMFSSAQPYDEQPRGHATPEEREAALTHALRGVELGDYDGRIVAWMLAILDTPTLAVIVGLLSRVRGAGMVDALDLQAHIDANKPKPPRYPAGGNPPTHGNSGPGGPLS